MLLDQLILYTELFKSTILDAKKAYKKSRI